MFWIRAAKAPLMLIYNKLSLQASLHYSMLYMDGVTYFFGTRTCFSKLYSQEEEKWKKKRNIVLMIRQKDIEP